MNKVDNNDSQDICVVRGSLETIKMTPVVLALNDCIDINYKVQACIYNLIQYIHIETNLSVYRISDSPSEKWDCASYGRAV